MCRTYMSYHTLLEVVCFVLSYSTHIWNEYVAGNLLKIKKTGKMKHAHNKDKARSKVQQLTGMVPAPVMFKN